MFNPLISAATFREYQGKKIDEITVLFWKPTMNFPVTNKTFDLVRPSSPIVLGVIS